MPVLQNLIITQAPYQIEYVLLIHFLVGIFLFKVVISKHRQTCPSPCWKSFYGVFFLKIVFQVYSILAGNFFTSFLIHTQIKHLTKKFCFNSKLLWMLLWLTVFLKWARVLSSSPLSNKMIIPNLTQFENLMYKNKLICWHFFIYSHRYLKNYLNKIVFLVY